MATKFVSKRNLEFLLYEVLDVLSLTQYDYYREHNRDMFDMVLSASLDIAQDLFLPILAEMDREPPELVDGKVRVHPAVRVPGMGVAFPPGTIDFECRPYHLGWLLYCWSAARAASWDASGGSK